MGVWGKEGPELQKEVEGPADRTFSSFVLTQDANGWHFGIVRDRSSGTFDLIQIICLRVSGN